MNSTATRGCLAIGGLSAVLSLFVLPIARLVLVYTSYKIHGYTKNIYSYLPAGVESFSVLFWMAFLVRLQPQSTAGHPAVRDDPKATLSSNANHRDMTQDGCAEGLEPVRRRIMEAAYRVLQKHDYGNLTIRHIVDELENSKTLLCHHYDRKGELLVGFLDYVLTQFLNSLPQGDRTPGEELKTFIDTLLPETLSEEAYRLQLSMFKFRVNAPHDEGCREEYHHVDAELTELLRDILVCGIEADEPDVNDPKARTELFLSILTGTRARRLTVFKPDESIEPFRAVVQPHTDRISA